MNNEQGRSKEQETNKNEQSEEGQEGQEGQVEQEGHVDHEQQDQSSTINLVEDEHEWTRRDTLFLILHFALLLSLFLWAFFINWLERQFEIQFPPVFYFPLAIVYFFFMTLLLDYLDDPEGFKEMFDLFMQENGSK